MIFHDVNLPRFVEVFAIGQPEFNSSLVTTLSGREARQQEHELSRQKYLIKNCSLSESQFKQFNNFFRARRGRNFAFRFKDYADFKVRNQLVARGVGLKEFSLFKIYEDLIHPYYRPITKPVFGSVKLSIGEVIIEANVDYSNGKIELIEPLIAGQEIQADFNFDVPVRFCKDKFEYNYLTDGSIELADVELIEVFE